MNDTYEITPLNRGTVGGMARVATLKKRLAEEYGGRLLTVHAGDFVSPSAIGTAVVNGKPLAGQQMVDVLRAVGIDYIIFGNHEFDPDETTFNARLAELIQLRDLPDFGPGLDPAAVRAANDRRRALFSTNVLGKDGKPLPRVPPNRVWEPTDERGTRIARIGFVGLTIKTLKSKPADQYVTFVEPVDAARAQLAEWQKAGEKFDAVVALTHQSLDADEELVRAGLPIDLILGGHEHVNAHRRPVPGKPGGPPVPPIYRADANVRTVYLHKLFFSDAGSTGSNPP
jgi:5'-nucleotidase